MKTYLLDCGTSNTAFKLAAELTDGVLTVDVYRAHGHTDELTYEKVSTTTASISELLARNDSSDYAMYPIDMDGKALANLHSATSGSKLNMAGYAALNGIMVVGGIAVHAKSDPDTVSLFLCEYNGNTVTTTGDLQVQPERVTAYGPLFQSVSIMTSTRNGDVLEVQVQSSCFSPQTVYLETTAGVMLTPRVELNGGYGIGYLSLAGLPAGYSGKVKAGFKYFSGLAETAFTV